MEQKSNTQTIKIIGVIFVVVVVGIIGWQVMAIQQKSDTLTNKPTPTVQVNNASGSNNQQRHAYRNGKYSAEGSYQSPAQLEKIGVEVTLADGVITDSVFTVEGKHPTSKMMQQKFSEGFKKLVVGKNIDEVSLTVVNGSSLTPKGFMDALSKIKKQAGA